MLLPKEINPELSVYYNGAIILENLYNAESIDIMILYRKIKKINDMSLSTYILSLDWLFLSDIAVVTESGEVRLCS